MPLHRIGGNERPKPGTRNRRKECNEGDGTARGIEEHSRRGRREGGETFAILRDFRGISDGKR